MNLRPVSCPSLRNHPWSRTFGVTQTVGGDALVPVPPVHDAALKVTMHPMIHSFHTSPPRHRDGGA